MAVKKRQTTKALDMVKDVLVSADKNEYTFTLGQYIASGFSGFIAGLIVCSLVWYVIVQSYFL